MLERSRILPLGGRSLAAPDGRVAITPLPRAARFALRARPEHVEAAGVAFGVALPTAACRAQAVGARAALWLGPDEWLLIAEDHAETSTKNAFASIAAPLSLVEISHRQVAVELRGEAAVDVLAAGCPLDLHVNVFAVGACTRTLFGKCEIVLWRTAPLVFRMEFWRSYADYVSALLEIAYMDVVRLADT
jgi:sarcosine oxidase, subunit gamma